MITEIRWDHFVIFVILTNQIARGNRGIKLFFSKKKTYIAMERAFSMFEEQMKNGSIQLGRFRYETIIRIPLRSQSFRHQSLMNFLFCRATMKSEKKNYSQNHERLQPAI